ncbi:PadR family transcriptional regulator [Actinomycetospora aeridis]|uniref:Helix-turn-helix transcriptional regulator n=1 Tax=Actinomycetospora aeridis TaxID=3129231 RepID=A0ABU8NEI1_9PSEU
MTAAIRNLLAVFMAAPDEEFYGLELARGADLASGTLYPMLARLESAGLVESRHEAPELFQGSGRPPRRYYRLTRDGTQFATAALRPRHRTSPADVSVRGVR